MLYDSGIAGVFEPEPMLGSSPHSHVNILQHKWLYSYELRCLRMPIGEHSSSTSFNIRYISIA